MATSYPPRADEGRAGDACNTGGRAGTNQRRVFYPRITRPTWEELEVGRDGHPTTVKVDAYDIALTLPNYWLIVYNDYLAREWRAEVVCLGSGFSEFLAGSIWLENEQAAIEAVLRQANDMPLVHNRGVYAPLH